MYNPFSQGASDGKLHSVEEWSVQNALNGTPDAETKYILVQCYCKISSD